jgi:hypothetical protein
MTPLLWTTAAFTLGACIFFAGYYFGRFVSEGQARVLESQNAHLRDQVSFVQADCDHLRKLLETRVAEAHVEKGPTPWNVFGRHERVLRDAPPYAANIGLCFHGVSLSDHCERCLNRELVAGPVN